MPKEARPRNLLLLTEDELEERRPVLLKGVEEFNDGFFFEAHEVWEDLWYQCPLPGRTFLQGLIQLAAAFVHFVRREYPGTLGLLDAAIEKLGPFAPAYLGIDVARLAADIARARTELVELGAGRFEAWDLERVPRIHLV